MVGDEPAVVDRKVVEQWIEKIGLPHSTPPDNPEVILIDLKPKMIIIPGEKSMRVSLILGNVNQISTERREMLYQRLLELSGQMNLMKASLHGDTLAFDTDFDMACIDYREFKDGIINTLGGFEKFKKQIAHFVQDGMI